MMPNYFYVVLFICLILGICLVALALFLFSRQPKKDYNDYLERRNTMRVIENTIEELERMIKDLDNTSKAIFDEMDQKYGELMFLYSSIEELKADEQNYLATLPSTSSFSNLTDLSSLTNLSNLPSLQNKSEDVSEEPGVLEEYNLNIVVDDTLDVHSTPNSQLDRILLLQHEGLSISEISKHLNMGQGEVTLMLELGKVR